MPHLLQSLLHRMRTGILVMLLAVLPLQGVTQWVAGIQAHRHVHTGASWVPAPQGATLATLRGALRAVLDQLHAAQDLRLATRAPAWLPNSGPAAGLHAHGGVYHAHAADTADVLAVAEPADEPLQAGATVFQAWLPANLALPAAAAGERPASAESAWRDHAVAPPLMPPRG